MKTGMGVQSSRSRTANKNVGIVIVNWNNYEDTADCLNSIKNLSYTDYQVTVVDNGSTDGSGERLRREFEWCDFVINEHNRGFGGGCNSGIEHVLAKGVEFVLLLNNDAVVVSNTLDELVAAAAESGAPIVGASIQHGSGDLVNSSPSRYPDMLFYSGYRDNLPLDMLDEDVRNESWWVTDRVEGGGVLIAGELLRERKRTLGYYLDDSLFMYCEEIELAMWCRKRDIDSVIANEAVIKHDTGASSSRAFQLYYLTRNRVLIAHQYLRGLSRLLFDLLYPTTRLLLAGRFLKQGQQEVAKATVDGLFDGYRGIDGKSY